MTNLRKWGELYEMYKTTHRASVVKSLFKNKPFSKTWPYWVAFFAYIAISVATYIIGKDSSLSMLSIVLTVAVIYVWLEFRIAKEYRDYYETHKLKSHPFFLRSKYLSYILFSERLTANASFKTDGVDALVEWEDIRKEKINTFEFLETPGILLLLTAFSSVFIEYLKINNLVNTKYLYLLALALFVVLWFSWAVSDALKSHKKKSLEICRFLRWWKLDQ